MPFDSDLISVLNRFSTLSGHKLEDLLAISFDVVCDNVHRFLKLVLRLVPVDQNEIDEALEDALVLPREALEVELC